MKKTHSNLRMFFCFMVFSTSFCCSENLKVPNAKYYDKADDLRDHPGHKPFISHLTFRNICNHIIDQNTEWFDPTAVAQGDLVYINAWYLEWFAKNVHDQIRFPYILVCGDVGSWHPLPTIANKLLYDSKLSAWFCRNIIFSNHPKIFQIPMGQDFALFSPKNFQSRDVLLDAIANNDCKKDHLLYMNFFPRSYGNRDLVVKLFEDKSYCFSRNRSDERYVPVDYPTYFNDLARSKFTLSPLGLETDCVRTWEALIFHSIPIVQHTFLDPLYEELPVMIVDDWNQINPEFLEQKYEELKSLKNDKAYFQYWEDLIHKTQEKVRNGDIAFSQLDQTAFNQQDLEDLQTLLTNYTTLIYKGCLTAIRPLQIASSCPFLSSIFVYDPWINKETFNSFNYFVNDNYFLKEYKKIKIVDIPYILDGPQTRFNHLLTEISDSYAVFLDLTYYRHSLMTDFTSYFSKTHNILKTDLETLCNQLPIFTDLIGNEARNPYVKKTLEIFAKESNAEIKYIGSFWFLSKFSFSNDST